jgi:hypothetical protein
MASDEVQSENPTKPSDAWPYPRLWCPVCRRGCETLAELVAHQLRRRHWRPILPPAGMVKPADATTLKTAVEAVEARRPKEGR